MSIIRKNDVLQRLSKNSAQQIADLVNRINQELGKATRLPALIPLDADTDQLVVENVMERIKNAGWTITYYQETRVLEFK